MWVCAPTNTHSRYCSPREVRLSGPFAGSPHCFWDNTRDGCLCVRVVEVKWNNGMACCITSATRRSVYSVMKIETTRLVEALRSLNHYETAENTSDPGQMDLYLSLPHLVHRISNQCV